MPGFGNTVLATLLAVCLVAGSVAGDANTVDFDLEEIEVVEEGGQALVAFDAPQGSEVKAEDSPQRGELTLTFHGVTTKLPKRIHAGNAGSIVSSVDVEPWFVDGERVTRLVIRYAGTGSASHAIEGDLVVVTVTAPVNATAARARATNGASETAASNAKPADEAETSAPAEDPTHWENLTAASASEPAPMASASEPSPMASASEPAPMASASEPAPMASASEPAPAAEEAPAVPAEAAARSAGSDEVASEGVASEDAAVESFAAGAPAASEEPPRATALWNTEKTPARIAAPTARTSSEPVAMNLRGSDYQDTSPDPPTYDGPTITIDLQGADIHTVLRSISESSGRNIVANADVGGAVSLMLNDVPWLQALEMVLRTHGLGYVEEGGIIRVARAETLRAEVIARETAARKKDELVPLETTVVPVRFAAAMELTQAISTILSPRGRIKEDVRTNSLVITDIPSILPQVNDLVGQLDGRTPQVEIVAKLVDVDMSAVREFGIDWGVNNIHSTPAAISANAGVGTPIANAAGGINFGIIRDFADLDVALQLLEQNQRANIISNPKISTVNNREARILVGQEIPLIVMDEAGNAITELKKIGIELRVTPYINQDGLITLDLHPEVSDLASQSTQQGGVIINTSEADTRVMVTDGETAVIGGLIRSNETEFRTGIPVLHKIPIIGGLFGSTSKAKANRELVIFVTPRIVE